MFKLPNEIIEASKDYKSSLEDSIKGITNAARFKGIRVPWGIYSHRGGNIYMTRIRIPAGVITPSQLRALSIASQKYSRGALHITTRQDIQIHNVKLEDTVKVIEYLKDFNLSPRGGGGNSIRNITACALSGLCKDELFDVSSFATSLTEYLLRQDSSYNLPRKLKFSFSGCQKDCAGCLANDLGFLAKFQGSRKGFKVFVGGGMGLDSRIAKALEEFIPAEDLGYVAESVKNVFNKIGDRKNRHHNRLRFLIDDIGLEEFKKHYKKEFSFLKENEYITLRKIDFPEREESEGAIPQLNDQEYNEFLKYNLQPQKQAGFSAVQLRIPRGDISAQELTALADLEKEFEGIEFCASQNQNLFICWVNNSDVYKLFLKLKGILKDFLYPETLLDVVVCKGALTCNLGLCNSPGLSEEIEGLIKKEFIGKKVFANLEIKLNGCPNACGQQPLGKLSFHGMVRKVDNRPAPFYKFLLGGRKEAENTRFGEEVGIIPAKNIPQFLRDFLSRSEEIINKERDVRVFLENEAQEIAAKILEKYSYVPAYAENRDFYIDWGKSEEFSLSGLGPGECGAGVLDMIESDLREAKLALENSKMQGCSFKEIKSALFFSSRALLIVKGVDPKTEEEVFFEFKEKFIKQEMAAESFAGIKEIFNSLSRDLNAEERKEKFLYAKAFFEHINQLYKDMDSSFNFPKQKAQKLSGAGEKQNYVLDLKGVPCPINYVKSKLFLENLGKGDILEIILDKGEPINNVPKSLQNDGHKIISTEKQNGFYKVIVEKG